jgi:hypothetical protein
MLDFGKRQLGWTGFTCVLLGLAGLPAPGVAGTGRLLSPWVNRAPRIDGAIAPGEWDAARLVDLGAGVTLYLENDARTLYLAVRDSGDLVADASDAVELLFDDEGGSAPILDDGTWSSPVCQAVPGLGEGWIDFRAPQTVDFREYAGGFCPPQAIADRVSFRSAGGPQGVTYEIALPLDGPAPLRGAAGQRFAVLLLVYRNGAQTACLPNCAAVNVPDFRNLVLASGGCNTGPQTLGSGDPLVGLPLDWTGENTAGGGPGWVQSPPAQFGDPVFCEGNDTGGTGGAACVSNFSCTQPRTDSLLRMPLALAGMTAATVRARAVLQVADLHEYLDISVRRLDTSGNSLLFWLDQSQNASVDLWIPVAGSPPVELWFVHSTFSAGGAEGGYAQIDDVELVCGPAVFGDGFESGLTTHWSADAP